MDTLTNKERIIEDIESQPVAMLLLRNYIHAQIPFAKRGDTPCMNEIEEANQKGLGLSLNSVFFLRSINAIGSSQPAPDISFLYGDLQDYCSWKSLPELEEHLRTDDGSFNDGISFKDGFIFGFEKEILEDAIGPVYGDPGLRFYHHKVVGGEPRGEFYSVMRNIYGTDMRKTLGELFNPDAVGSGTTSLVSDQCFGALSAGPLCTSRQYRLRKTKISNTLDIGHLLIYDSRLREDVRDELAHQGFEFSDVLDPDIPLAVTVYSLLDCFRKSEMAKRYRSPAELYHINKILIYGERDSDEGQIKLVCRARSDGIEEIMDISDYAFSNEMARRC